MNKSVLLLLHSKTSLQTLTSLKFTPYVSSKTSAKTTTRNLKIHRKTQLTSSPPSPQPPFHKLLERHSWICWTSSFGDRIASILYNCCWWSNLRPLWSVGEPHWCVRILFIWTQHTKKGWSKTLWRGSAFCVTSMYCALKHVKQIIQNILCILVTIVFACIYLHCWKLTRSCYSLYAPKKRHSWHRFNESWW